MPLTKVQSAMIGGGSGTVAFVFNGETAWH
jgi:hypothetical protein